MEPHLEDNVNMEMPLMEGRFVHIFYKKLSSPTQTQLGKVMCVAYKFDKIVTVDDGSSMDGCEVDSKLFFACGACIMEYKGNYINKKQLRCTARGRLEKCPIYFLAPNTCEIHDVRNKTLVKYLRIHGCKGNRSATWRQNTHNLCIQHKARESGR